MKLERFRDLRVSAREAGIDRVDELVPRDLRAGDARSLQRRRGAKRDVLPPGSGDELNGDRQAA